MSKKIIIYLLFFISTLCIPTLHAKIDPQSVEYELFDENNNPFPFPNLFPVNPSQIDVCIQTKTRATTRKPWTIMIYIAADNDLRAFAANNIKQMCTIGSNHNINIVVHLDIRLNGNQKVSRRYFIEKGKIVPMDEVTTTAPMDSGKPKTLISFCEMAIKNFPAQHYALILWNHGTGIIDPRYYKIINPTDLFSFNRSTNQLELDRSIGFLDLLDYKNLDDKGICMDSSNGTYLSNQDLVMCFQEICTRLLGNRKLDLVGLDACLMSMIEIADIFEKYAHIMVSSQEVELGTGWNYARVLQPLSETSMDAKSLAYHIVEMYQNSYQPITKDYTLSAIELSLVKNICRNVDSVARILIECLKHQQNNSVKNTLRACRNKKACTSFDEPSYVDLHHFYQNLLENLPKLKVNANKAGLINELQRLLRDGIKQINTTVFANVTGRNLQKARGLSVYFPENRIHESYPKTQFAKNTQWLSFISSYLR